MSIKSTKEITKQQGVEIINKVYNWYSIRPHYINPIKQYNMDYISEYSIGEIEEILDICIDSPESDIDGYPISILDNFIIKRD